jgi:NADH-quinone oxidoreductase subunit M
MLIPVYFLIGGYGSGERAAAAVKFLLYSLFGGLLMLASIIGLYVISGTHGGHTFDIGQLSELHTYMSSTTQNLLFLGFFIAFAIKAPVWPLHTWLPDAAAAATPGTSVLLLGVLDKVGTFGMSHTFPRCIKDIYTSDFGLRSNLNFVWRIPSYRRT